MVAFGPKPVCPVCGKELVMMSYWSGDYEIEGTLKRVRFCGPDCKNTFEKDPEKYVKEAEAKGWTLGE